MQLYLSVNETGTDVASNSSSISWSLTAYNDSANHIYNKYTSGGSAPTWGVNVGGITGGGNFTYDVEAWGTIWIAGGSGTIYHDADGRKTISFSGEANGKNGSYFGAIYTSGSKTLTTIPRTSSFSLGSTSVAVGSNQTITINKATSSYTDVVTYSCEGATGTISSNASGTINWTIPDAIENKMTAKTSATCTITCTTKNGSTVVGSSSKTFTVTIPSSYVPTVTFGATSLINAYGGKMVGGYSSVTQNYSVGLTPAANSATIKDITVTLNKGTIASKGNTSATTNVLPSETSDYTLTISVKATDTRGRTTTQHLNIGTVYAFVAPSISVQNLYRSDDQGTPLPEGTYAYTNVVIGSEYAITVATAKINNVTYNLVEASGSWMAILGNDDLDPATQYNVVYTVRDQFMVDMDIPAIQVSQTLSSMKLPISLYDDGSNYGVTIGQMATGSGFNCYMPSFMIDKRYKHYDGVNRLGLIAGEPTLQEVWDAMPNLSVLLCQATDFPSTEVPTIYGMVEIVKMFQYKTFARFIGNTKDFGEYMMWPNSAGYLSGLWVQTGGTIPIPQNADLNSYTTCGTFYAGSNAIANSLANKPTSLAFTLEVSDPTQTTMNGDGTYVYRRQVATNYQGSKMVRYGTSNSGMSGFTWNGWLTVEYFNAQSITVSGNAAITLEAPILIRRFGSIVTISYGSNLTVNSGYTEKQILLGTINGEFRPTYASQTCSGNTIVSNKFYEPFRWMVNTQGQILFWSGHQGAQEARCTITYIV